jgi:hypothetical protein
MSSINKTPHYNLSQFGDSPDDKPSWRGDYTADMSKIDSQMYRNETDATTAASTANTAKSTADNALSLAQTNKSDIAEHASYFTALGVTSESTAQALMSTINGKAENTALTTLQGTVSSLSSTVDTKANTSDVYTKSQADARYTQQGGYAGTASTIYEMASGAQSSITSLQSTGVAPIQVVSQNVLTDYFANGACVLTAYYSPISRMIHIMLRVGAAEGTGVTPKKAYPGNLSTKIATIEEQYRPTVSIQSPTQPISNPGSLSNILVMPTGEIKFWGGSSGLSTSASINATFQTSYFIVR